MRKYGEPPYLECSTRGFKKFSPFYARPKSLQGKSIEEAYQAMKILEDGSTGHTWKEAKGKKAINLDDCVKAYSRWWKEYIDENPDLLKKIKETSGFSDMFAYEHTPCCQAEELWRIRCKVLSEGYHPSGHPLETHQ